MPTNYADVYEDLRRAKTRSRTSQSAKIKQKQDAKLVKDAEKLRDALIEGLADHVAVPEVSTDNASAAHDLLGCPLHAALLSVVRASGRMPREIGDAMRIVLVESVTGMAFRLLAEDLECLKRQYGYGHQHSD